MKINRHILVVDDDESIHQDFEKILNGPSYSSGDDYDALKKELFDLDKTASKAVDIRYEMDHAYQGEEAVNMVTEQADAGNPYSLIFMDVRMPPGMDGIQTIQSIWQRYPDIEMVICTAYSDHSWEKIIQLLGSSDNLLFMKKPFDATALKQVALSLTTKWQLQRETMLHTDQLEKKVQERTQQLIDMVVEFKKVKEKAQKQSQSDRAYLASVSDQIRTQIGVVSEMNDMLLKTDLNNEQMELSELIGNNAEAITHMTDDILEFSKNETGKFKLQELSFSLRRLMEDVRKTIALAAKGKPVEVSCALDDQIPDMLVGDPDKIQKILLNFGLNAIQDTERGTITFAVNALNLYEKEVHLSFSVKYTGKGIPAEKIGNIFEPFEFVNYETNDSVSGSGLGLAINKQLAEIMEGDVGAKSKVDQGSQFWFTVKLVVNS